MAAANDKFVHFVMCCVSEIGPDGSLCLSLCLFPFSRRESFHGQGVYLVVLHFVAQGGVDLLMPRNQAQAFKLR